MKCIYLCSRDWSIDILRSLLIDLDLEIVLVVYIGSPELFTLELPPNCKFIHLDKFSRLADHLTQITFLNPDVIFAYGWSGFLPKSITDSYPSLILHPSRVPLYRGGSPIQNQILDGNNDSSVSIIQATDQIDAGPVLYQSTLPLNGTLKEIKQLIVYHGIAGTKFLQLFYSKHKRFFCVDQCDKSSTTYKRRTPEMSEIKLEDFATNDASKLHDKVRSLQDDYPLAYIECKNRTRLYLLDVLHG